MPHSSTAPVPVFQLPTCNSSPRRIGTLFADLDFTPGVHLDFTPPRIGGVMGPGVRRTGSHGGVSDSKVESRGRDSGSRGNQSAAVFSRCLGLTRNFQVKICRPCCRPHGDMVGRSTGVKVSCMPGPIPAIWQVSSPRLQLTALQSDWCGSSFPGPFARRPAQAVSVTRLFGRYLVL